MYRASDEVENERWLEQLSAAADDLGLSDGARSHAGDLFLSDVPDADRSKPAAIAASLYVAALIDGDRRSQSEVADAVGVSRLSVQQRWKDLLEEAGLDAPDW